MLVVDSAKSGYKNQKPVHDLQTLEYNIEIGNLVRLNSYAKSQYELNKYKGCCRQDDEVCICEKMFGNENLTGLVVQLDLPLVDISWSNDMRTSILIDNIELIS